MAISTHRKRVLATAVTLIISLLGVVWWLSFSPEVVTVKDALDDFRARVSTTLMAKSPARVPRGPHAIPPIGVYTYKTVGRESLDGPLNESHDYPAESAITITASDCGFDWRWEVFERRSDTNTWCWTNSGLTESRSTTDHIFFNVHDKRTFVCQPVAVVLPSDPAATSSSICAGSDTVNAHTAQVAGTESLQVGGDTVDTVIVKATDVAGKKSRGTSTVTLWLRASDGLIVKMHRIADIKNNSIIGAIHYTEDITLTLSSLLPQR